MDMLDDVGAGSLDPHDEQLPSSSEALAPRDAGASSMVAVRDAAAAAESQLAPPRMALDALTVRQTQEVMVRTFGEAGDLVEFAGSKAVPRFVTYDVLDCTLGGGHHTAAVLAEGDPFTRVVALDCDHAVRRTAAAMREQFGVDRFQFFPHKMSDILTLFGSDVFDAMIVDAGPNMDQLDDLKRGFTLDATATAGDFDLDLRYGPHMQTNARQWIVDAGSANVEQMAEQISFYGNLPLRVSFRFVKALKRLKVSTGSGLREALDDACPEPPSSPERMSAIDTGLEHSFVNHPWLEANATSASRRSFAHRAMIGLRALVNNERRELLESLRQGLEVVRPEGKICVVTREPWERELVSWFAAEHPRAVLAGSEQIGVAEALSLRTPPETTVWTIQRIARGSAFRVKNAISPPSPQELERSYLHWLSGGNTGMQLKGFPAVNFRKSQSGRDRAKERQRLGHRWEPRDNARKQRPMVWG